jgi:hypothetical protein
MLSDKYYQQVDLIDIYSILHASTLEIPFSNAHRSLTKTNWILGYKTKLDKAERKSQKYVRP